MCDCGGGTVDLILYTITQVQPYLKFEELCVGVGEYNHTFVSIPEL